MLLATSHYASVSFLPPRLRHDVSPLTCRSHLLGKKSWNVYNADNIARVRRDEAAARVREEADEQRMQQADADRRLAILRGEEPPAPPLPTPFRDAVDTVTTTAHSRPGRDGSIRKRKRAGEDDTDFEMRVAREHAEAGDRASRELMPLPSSSLVDSAGHISLFGGADELTTGRAGGNEEYEQDKKRKERELANQHQVRLADAAGRDGQGLTDGRAPWYATVDGEAPAALVPSTNVWGKQDPGRKVREAARLDAGDPLAMMKRGAAMVRDLGKERRREVEEREKELRLLRKEERRREKRRRRREDGDRDDANRTDQRGPDGRHNNHRERNRHRHRHERDTGRDEERYHRRRSRRPEDDARHTDDFDSCRRYR